MLSLGYYIINKLIYNKLKFLALAISFKRCSYTPVITFKSLRLPPQLQFEIDNFVDLQVPT